MTREEAIAIIRKEYLCVDRDCDIERSCSKCDLVMPNKEPILEAYKMAIEALEQEPTYKTGHWIKYGTPRCEEQHYKCTSCGYYINFGQWGELYTKEFKYCPNCGCRMVKPQESEE